MERATEHSLGLDGSRTRRVLLLLVKAAENDARSLLGGIPGRSLLTPALFDLVLEGDVLREGETVERDFLDEGLVALERVLRGRG